MKRFTLFISLFILLTLTLGAILLSGLSKKLTPETSLTITTFPANLPVFLDGVEIGTTPLTRSGLSQGEYTLRIKNWEEKIRLEPSTPLIVSLGLSPDPKLVKGFEVSYQKKPFLSRGSSLEVLINQAETDILVKGQNFEARDHGKSLSLTGLSEGKYQVRVEKEGFLAQDFEFETWSNYLTLAKVNLMPDLFLGTGKQSEEQELKENEFENQVEINNNWRNNTLTFTQNGNLATSPWQKLTLLKTSFNSALWGAGGLNDYLNQLEFQSQLQFGNLGLPFCYLVNEQGQIFEGLGIFNYDFSQVKLGDEVSFKKGECPVAYLAEPNSTVQVPKPVSESFEKLAGYLARGPLLSAQVLINLEKLRLAPGEEREILLEYKNTSGSIWQKTEGERVLLGLTPLDMISDLYNSDWLSSSYPAVFEQKEVLPGEVASYTFKIKAPFYPLEITQKLALYNEKQGKMLKNSEFELQINVEKEGAGVTEITKTPTGFLNIRESPNLNSRLLGTAYEGEKYFVLEKLPGWYKILLHNGGEGFISAQYSNYVY